MEYEAKFSIEAGEDVETAAIRASAASFRTARDVNGVPVDAVRLRPGQVVTYPGIAMAGTWMYVTPEIVRGWHKVEVKQRPTRASRKTELRDKALRGEFVQTHQGIGLASWYGGITDGEHRAKMILSTGKPQWFWVFFNLPAKAVDGIDVGLSRNLADLRTYKGVDLSNEELKMLRAFYSGARGRMSAPAARLGHVWFPWAETHEAAIKFTSEHLKGDYVRIASLRACIARAWYVAPLRSVLARFCAILSGAETLTAIDTNASMLRGIVIEGSHHSVYATDVPALYLYEAAIYAVHMTFMGSAIKRRLRVRAGDKKGKDLEDRPVVELFPLPEEPGWSEEHVAKYVRAQARLARKRERLGAFVADA